MKKIVFAITLIAILVFVAACAAPTTEPTKAPAPTNPPAATSAPVSSSSSSVASSSSSVAPTKVPPSPTVPPAPTATAAPKRGGTFIDASFADATSLQPLLTNDSASTSYQSLIWASLTRLDPKTLDVTGVLYEDQPEFSADGSTMTWKLRKGLKWSDGSPITSKDVIFSWQKMMDDKVKFPYRQNYKDAFADLTAPDDFTVVYKLAKPGYCPAKNQSGLLNGIIPQQVFGNLDININDVNNKPTVTSGYFKFKEWQKDDHFTASPAFDGFVRGQPLLDAWTVRILKDNTVQTQMFKAQEIDYASPDAPDWDEITKLPFAQPANYYSAVGAPWDYIGFNTKKAPFDDKVVRQAISMALNKQEMIDKIVLGHAKPLYSIFPSSSWAAADAKDLTQFNFDPAKAKKMLDDAGYKLGPDGIRLTKDGKPMKYRLFYNAGNKRRESIAIISQQSLKDIGIQVEVLSEEFSAYLDRIQKTHDVEMYILGWTGGSEPATSKNIWSTTGGQNDSQYANAEVDKLFDQAASVPGCKQADRKAIYVKIQQIISDDQPYVFLFTRENLLVYNKRISILPMTGLGATYNVEQLSVNPSVSK